MKVAWPDHQSMLKLPFLNKKFPKFKPKKWRTILNFEKFQQLGDPQLIDEQISFFLNLVDNTLVYHPDRRLTIDQVMNHPFLTSNSF